MSSSLIGGRVKEPKVTYRRPFHVSTHSDKLSELSEAWSSFDKAKSTLNHLQTTLEPQVEDENVSQYKSHTRYRQVPVPEQPQPQTHTHVTGKSHDEHVVQGTILNDTAQQNDHLYHHKPHSIRGTSTKGSSDTGTLLSSVYRDSPSHQTSLHRGFPSHQTSLHGGFPSHQTLLHRGSPSQNIHALFGPVNFGDKPHPTTSSKHTTLNGIDGTQVSRPRLVTRKTHSSGGKTDTRVSYHTGMLTDETSHSLHLPKETLTSLVATVEKQKEFDFLKRKKPDRSHTLDSRPPFTGSTHRSTEHTLDSRPPFTGSTHRSTEHTLDSRPPFTGSTHRSTEHTLDSRPPFTGSTHRSTEHTLDSRPPITGSTHRSTEHTRPPFTGSTHRSTEHTRPPFTGSTHRSTEHTLDSRPPFTGSTHRSTEHTLDSRPPFTGSTHRSTEHTLDSRPPFTGSTHRSTEHTLDSRPPFTGSHIHHSTKPPHPHSTDKNESSDRVKRRKVATAPLPKSYVGFTSTVSSGPILGKTRHKPFSRVNRERSLHSDSQSVVVESEKWAVPVSHPPVITPSSWRTGKELVDKILGKETHPTSRTLTGLSSDMKPPLTRYHDTPPITTSTMNIGITNSVDLLQDMDESHDEEDSSHDEEEEDEVMEEMDIATKLRKVLHQDEPNLEETSKRVRHYDIDSVQRYMKFKQEEKKRKANEEKEAQIRAQKERERRLKGLQEKQRRVLTTNLLNQQRMKQRQTKELLQESIRGPHLYNERDLTVFSSSSSTSHRLPLSVSHHLPSSRSSPRPVLPRSSSVPLRTLSSPHTSVSYSSPNFAYTCTSPLAVQPTLTYSTPPVINRTSPCINITFSTPPPVSLSPPWTTSNDHSLEQTLYTPPLTFTPTRSPPRMSPSRVPPRSPISPRLDDTSTRHEARILALKHSALSLRERISSHKKLMAAKGLYTPPRRSLHEDDRTLPGVTNINEHVVAMETQKNRDKAATVIQSRWKGYNTRKKISRKVHPQTHTKSPVSVLKPVEHFPPSISTSSTQSGLNRLPYLTTSQSSHTPLTNVVLPITVTPPDQPSPWLQGEGDHWSVINIYTRRQEQLKRMLDEHPVSSSIDKTISKGGDTNMSYSLSFETKSSSSLVSEEEEEEKEEEEEEVKEHDDTVTVVPPTQVTSSNTSSSSSTHDTPDPSLSSHNDDMSAITPPGSPSFHDTVSTPVRYPHETPSTLVNNQGRYSPHSLELKLKAELNILETVEEGVRQLEGVQSARVVSLAQQETVALAQLLKSQKQVHNTEIQQLTDKAKKELQDAQKKFEEVYEEATRVTEQMRLLKDETMEDKKRHAHQLKQLEVESRQKIEQVNQQLLDTHSTITSTVLTNTQQQMLTAQEMAVGVAKAAAESAVLAALTHPLPSNSITTYKSDFEQSGYQTDSLNTSVVSMVNTSITSPPVSNSTSNVTSILIPVPLRGSESLTPISSGGSHRSESLTPVPSEISRKGDEERDGDKTVTEGESEIENGDEIEEDLKHDDEEEEAMSQMKDLESSHNEDIEEEFSHTEDITHIEDEVDEVSFRELLPSESHRLQQMRKKLHTPLSTSSDITVSHPVSGTQSGEVSPLSTGEESFFGFMSRMLQQYVKEEEMRAKHQTALLQLREKAIKEKTQAELEWLNIKKRQLQKRGDDVSMPPLLRRERGIRNKLKHEQAEIHRLHEAQKTASQERKLLLLQQQDISHLHHSAHYYKDKIKRYGSRNSREPSPLPSPCPSPSPSPSIDLTHEDILEQISLSSQTSSVTASPIKTLSYSVSSDVSHHFETTPPHVTKQQIHSPAIKTTPTSELTLLKLKQLSSHDAEKSLATRRQQLLKRRQTAEDLLQHQQELLKREKELDEEERNISEIINKAMEYYEERVAVNTKYGSDGVSMGSTQVNGEDTSNIPEEISDTHHNNNDISYYGTNTFESGDSINTGDTLITSTPHSGLLSRHEDSSVSERLEHLKEHLREKEKEIRHRETQHKKKRELLEQKEKLLVQSENLKIKDELDPHSTTHSAITTPDNLAINTTPMDPSHSTTHSAITTPDNLAIHTTPMDPSHSTTHSAITTPDNLAIHTTPMDPSHSTIHSTNESITIHDESKTTFTDNLIINGNISPLPVDEDNISPVISGSSISTVMSLSGDDDTLQVELLKSKDEEKNKIEVQNENEVKNEEEDKNENEEKSEDEEKNENEDKTEDEVKNENEDKTKDEETEEENITEELEEDESSPRALSPLPFITGDNDQFVAMDTQQDASYSLTFEQPITSPVSSHVLISPDKDKREVPVSSHVLISSDKDKGEVPVSSPLLISPVEDKGEVPVSSHLLITSDEGKVQVPVPSISSDEDKGEVGIVIGERVLVGGKVGGVVRYIGETEFASGIWIGVELDISKGINDGSVNGKRYFSCSPQYGVFAPPSKVFPEEENKSISNNSLISEQIEDDDFTCSTETQTHSTKELESTVSIISGHEDEPVSVDKDVHVDGVTEDLLQQLSDEAYNTVQRIWKEKQVKSKEIEESELLSEKTESTVDRITEQLLNVLITSEVSLMCDIKDIKTSFKKESQKESSPYRKNVSFSSEPLALVPCSKAAVNYITLCAWNALLDSDEHSKLEPSTELLQSVCSLSGAMLQCEESFVKLVYQLAIETIQKRNKGSRFANRLAPLYSRKPLSLEYIQSEVYTLLFQWKYSSRLPSVRYLNNGCRPGGKPVDSVDVLLIRELREEEPSWVNYCQDEESVKIKTADSILDVLINETVDIVNKVYSKRS